MNERCANQGESLIFNFSEAYTFMQVQGNMENLNLMEHITFCSTLTVR
jgi:hypothetical protein